DGTQVTQVIPIGGTFASLYCAVTSAPTTGNSWAFRLSDVTQGFTTANCTISDNATTCGPVTLNNAFSAGDLVEIQAAPTNTPSATPASCGVGFAGDPPAASAKQKPKH